MGGDEDPKGLQDFIMRARMQKLQMTTRFSQVVYRT
jgi:hypothetical protein